MSGDTNTTLDLRQTTADDLEALQTVLDGRQAQIHTGMPGIIVSFNATAVTAVVQPAIQAIQSKPDGTRQPMSISPIHDVPVHFPGGGGHTLTFPVKPGDECWLSFSERSIDNWFQHGGTLQPSDWRMHDITDAVAHVGVRSQPNLPAGGVDPDTVQLRSDDKKTVVQVDGKNQAITLYANGAGEAVVFVDGANQAVTLKAENVMVGDTGNKLGVLGTAPVAKGTITGSYNGNVALKNLLQFLQSRGDIIDGST